MDILYEKALESINKMFSDISVSKEETKINLQSLKDEIDLLISTIDI